MIPSFLKENETYQDNQQLKGRRVFFVDKTSKNMAAFLVTGMQQWNSSQKNGLLQSVNATVKLLFVLSFIILISVSHIIDIQLYVSVFLFFLFLLSRISLRAVYSKAAVITFFFGFLVFIPASLNLFVKGDLVIPLIQLDKEYNWLVYHIPAEIGVTREGLLLVSRLCLKVFNSVLLTLLLIYSTSFDQIIKALRILHVPEIFVLTLTMSYKFIFIFSQTLLESYWALKMRWWNRGRKNEAGDIIIGRMGYLFRKSWERYELVFQAMMARGYTGNVRLYYTEKFTPNDYLFTAFALLILGFFIVLNFI